MTGSGGTAKPRLLRCAKAGLSEFEDEVEERQASRMGWLGVIETPDGGAGITLGNVGISAHILFPTGSPAVEGNARASEGSFDSQRLFADMGVSFTSYSQKADQWHVQCTGYPGRSKGQRETCKRIIDQLRQTRQVSKTCRVSATG